MNYWLFKTEPDECSIDDVAGDQVFIYHSSCKDIGIAGIAKIVKTAYPDPSQFVRSSPYYDVHATADKPRWLAVDLLFVSKLSQLIRLDKLKSLATLRELPLVRKGNRLSVMPVTCAQWRTILALT